jgi:fibrillarin-like pre-rRNA processing protein
VEETIEVLGMIKVEETIEVLGMIKVEEMIEVEETIEVPEMMEKETIESIKEDQIQKREISLEEGNQSFFWIKSEGEKKLATENLVPGNQVYKEKLIIKQGVEYRLWDPFRSKLAASIMNELEEFPFENKTKVLYLGASTGTTVSHVSDIVGPSGIVFSVEHASRVARDFLDRVASFRKNIIPILKDARKPKEYFSVFGKVDVVYVDIAQPDQTKIAIDNCHLFLKKGGYFFLVIKTRSIDVTKSPKKIIEQEIEKLKTNFDVLQSIDLHPYDKDHAMVIAKYRG